MAKQIIQHQIKLPKSLMIILVLLIIGLFANVYGPMFVVKDALAELYSGADLNLNVQLTGREDITGRDRPIEIKMRNY